MSQYDFLIDSICFLSWILVLCPSSFYLISKAGWAARRQTILTYFSGHALRRYFALYFPSLRISGESDEQLGERFRKHYACYYGRRHFVIPLLLLAAIAGVGVWGTAQTLKTWQTGHGVFAWPPIILSAFLGAYTWVTSDQLSRLRRRDLSPGDIYNGVFRFLIAAPFGVALATVAKEDVGVPVAFLIGVFPTTTLFTIARRIASQRLSVGEDLAAGQGRLELLENIDKGNAERFSDEGVATIAQLAWTDPVDLSVRTNFEFNYVVDCMSQALLAVYLGENIKNLGIFSLRTSMDAAAMIRDMGPDIEGANPTAEERDARKALIEAAATLKTDPKALRYTLTSAAEDPYTDFIWSVWGLTAPLQGRANRSPVGPNLGKP
jgi:hypothetical protein